MTDDINLPDLRAAFDSWVKSASKGPTLTWLDDDRFEAFAAGYCAQRQAVPQQALEALHDMTARKDAAYEERNMIVAALAKLFPSGTARTAIEGWSEDWHNCVYIDLPTGQVSWHFHDSQAHLFADLPPYTGEWDGHDTPEKYRRVAALRQAVPQGWKLVPKEPTQFMCDAAYKATQDQAIPQASTIWRAMLSASPTPPASEPVREPFKLNPPPIYDEHYAATQDSEPVQDAASVEGLMELVQSYGDYREFVGPHHDVSTEKSQAIRAYAQRLKEGK